MTRFQTRQVETARLCAMTGAWAVLMTDRGVEQLGEEHVPDVVALLAAMGHDPEHIRDPDGLARYRRSAALKVIAWCPSPERLARWCVVARRRKGARNVVGYLLRAAGRGDPQTLLSRVGGGEGVLAPEHERALVGERAGDVSQLVGVGAAILSAPLDEALRAQLRLELRTHLERLARCVRLRRPAEADRVRHAARRTLIALVGPAPTDDVLARDLEGIVDVAEARRLLAA